MVTNVTHQMGKCKICKKSAVFNHEGEIAGIYCKTHAEPDMINIRAKHCAQFGCKVQPTYNIPSETSRLYCGTHALPGMIYILGKYCEHDNCKGRPMFNTEGEPGLYCKKHANSGMVDVVTKRCKHNGCTKINPGFNIPGEIVGIFCKIHATKDMIFVLGKRCKYEGCTITPSFNKIGEKSGIFCVTHAEPGMVDVDNKKCKHSDCKKQPTYNKQGLTVGIFCKTHAYSDMIDVLNKRCAHKDCKKRPNYNDLGNTSGIFCKTHAKEGMIDIINPHCKHDKCTTRVLYGFPGKARTHCAKHRKSGMIKSPRGRCKIPHCKTMAIYGDTKPLRCELHKIDKDNNFTERPCKSCKLPYVLDNKELCENCNPESFKRGTCAKQNEVFAYLDMHNLPGTTTDKMIDHGVCGKERPDRIFELDDRVIILEIDENQHKSRPCECEQTRMVNITHAFGGLPVLWIRYNPDDYKSRAAAKTRNHRMKVLEKVINHSKTIKISTLASVLHLYFDGWIEASGTTKWQTLIDFEPEVVIV